GRLIVAEDVAADVAALMGDLFALRFPIESMVPVDVYGGDDGASMAANNTSAFNCRLVTGGSGWSDHAIGRAIDLNPIANPFVSGDIVLPPAGVDFLDRSQDRTGMVHADDAVVRAFAARGWSWGGAWTRPLDYQHFYRSRDG
ncbi:MAG: M15 family metallopeptidase, partial [Actinomycetes bacterium]|nr:M15 family metallopeptidase [Actinomycetes bacterium]MDX5380641.1 M15 family metallopeptidase [Actinomycetes bacterium]MDX5399593.1 M15 family metallopeptidase [Actinomycetes bacterium]MDX5450383.1 M15 family metallopeptidase [Actinomycetes bacterium]